METIMAPGHPRWDEFCKTLGGPGYCDFQDDNTWTCRDGIERPFAHEILRSMGLSEDEVRGSLSYFEQHGGFCDCEILFNVNPYKEDVDADEA